MKSTFSVIYYLKRQVVKKDGAVGDGLFHLWTSGHTRLSASGSKEQRERKII